LKAILFDMDGVLVDSEPVIRAAAAEGLRRFGVPAIESDFIPFTGMGEDRFIGGVAEKHGHPYDPSIKALVYEIYGQIVDERLVVYKDTLPALRALKAGGARLALASSADHVKINHNLRVAKIPCDIFSAVIGGEDVVRKKPHPDIYLLAAERLGVSAAECAVVEDAISGIAAGKAAGAMVIGVATSFAREALYEAGADVVISDISEIQYAVDELDRRRKREEGER
jgi:HAD superfamily hydrolase (TIGR01509 family)